jgi:fatty acid desaturase
VPEHTNTTVARRLDLPTLSVAATIYGGFLLWSLGFAAMPVWLAVPLGTVLLAWHGSLQHETIHGHPTSSKRINTLIGGLPLSLWIPYAVYRKTHLQHHRHTRARLTEVGHDPESFYWPSGHLATLGRIRRAILTANCTLAGRIVIGPAIAIVTFWTQELRAVRSSRRHLFMWCRHAWGAGAVLVWTVGIAEVPWYIYVLVVYLSVSLTHLRSFAEHSAEHATDLQSHLRTNVVEAHPLWALLFLNNNLHIAHHAHPGLPWHELPNAWRRMRSRLAGTGRVFAGGYSEVCRKHLFRPFITPEHPVASAPRR